MLVFGRGDVQMSVSTGFALCVYRIVKHRLYGENTHAHFRNAIENIAVFLYQVEFGAKYGGHTTFWSLDDVHTADLFDVVNSYVDYVQSYR